MGFHWGQVIKIREIRIRMGNGIVRSRLETLESVRDSSCN